MVSEFPPPDDTQSEWTIVGERIRIARESSGISVRELARRIGVSPSHVSNVERGLASFSVRALYSVVSHLDISMDSLFEDAKLGASQETAPLLGAVPDAPKPQRTRLDESGIVLRKGERPTIHLGNRRWERLTSASPLREAEFLEVHYAPGADKEELPDFLHHQSREWEPSSRVTSTFRWDTTKPSCHRATRSPSRRTCPTDSGTSPTKRSSPSGSSLMRGRWTRAIRMNQTIRACSGRPVTCVVTAPLCRR